MKRTLAIMLVLVLIVGIVAGCTKKEDEVVELRLGTNLPAQHTLTLGYISMAEKIKEKSNGRLVISVFPSEQLGKEKDVTDAIANKTGDMAVIGPGEMARRYDPCLIFDAPYVFEGADHLLAFANGAEGKKLWDEQAEQTNIRNLGMIYYGTRQVTSNKKVTSPEEMAGFKLRVPDQPMPLAYGKGLGAKPTPMAFGEVYLALQQGVVDGQENPVPTIVSNKFDEVQKYLVKTSHVVAAVGVIISEEKYQGLSDDLRKILDEEVAAACKEMSDSIVAEEKSLEEELKSKGMEIVEPEVEAFKENCKFIYEEYESKWGEGLYDVIQSVK